MKGKTAPTSQLSLQIVIVLQKQLVLYCVLVN